MKWTNVETKCLPIGQSANLLRAGDVVAYGKLTEKLINEHGTKYKFLLAGYGDQMEVEDVTHYHIPKPPDGRSK